MTGVFLKMASRSCVSGCGRFLTSSDGHDRCPSCLGFRHAEAALVDESCSHCGNMTMAMLRSRYLHARHGGIPLALPRSSSSGRRTTSAQGQGDLRITVRASPSSTSPRASHSSSTSHHLGFPDEYAGSSDRARPSISFGAPADDGISVTASGDELGSGEDDSAALPPSGRVALPESDPELTAMLSRAAESIRLHYRRPPSPERSRLDDWFLGAQAERRQPPPVPFFPEVHEEVTRSWKAPFSARNRPSASSVSFLSAVAYQLPRVAGSMACSAPLQNAATREACTGPLGQHCDRCVHQPPGRSTLPSHVATRPPSPPLELEASEVASRRSCPRRAQPCSRRALTSARPSGRMATPPRGNPADLETLRGRSGRCLTASCFSPCPRGPSVQMRWHAAGLGAYANMRFPQ